MKWLDLIISVVLSVAFVAALNLFEQGHTTIAAVLVGFVVSMLYNPRR